MFTVIQIRRGKNKTKQELVAELIYLLVEVWGRVRGKEWKDKEDKEK